MPRLPTTPELRALERKTGLHANTIRDLIVNGWVYVEEAQPPRWEKQITITYLRKRQTT